MHVRCRLTFDSSPMHQSSFTIVSLVQVQEILCFRMHIASTIGSLNPR